MPYISKEKVKEVRQKMKKNFPDFKFSVKGGNSSSLTVTVLSGPIDFGTEHTQINHYHIEKFWGEKKEAMEFLLSVLEVMDRVESQKTQHVDADYGSIPNYYQNIHIGEWDKPYEVTNQ